MKGRTLSNIKFKKLNIFSRFLLCFMSFVTTASRVFTDLLSKSPKRSPRFSPGYEGTEKMFYFLSKACLK